MLLASIINTGGWMVKEISVLLVEDDFYARHWMEMLLRRDWRTRVVDVVKSPLELAETLKEINKHSEHVDLVLIDTDIPQQDDWLADALRVLADRAPGIKVLLTGVAPERHIARMLGRSNVVGYVLKDEIRYTLAWAVSLSVECPIVITRSILQAVDGTNPLPRGTLILDGCNSIANFTRREAEAARLAFMFSMERREMADELKITEDYSYGLVSSLYEKMGLNDILSGEVGYEQYFGNDPVIKRHLQQAIETLRQVEARPDGSARGKSRKIKDKETLAFHLLTLPEIEEIS
jgi:DNA-binding NarL/FixJ family response regulator